MTWTPLRTYITEHVDAQIAAEPNPEARAVLAHNRKHIVAEMEAAVLRQMVADRPTKLARARKARARLN